MLDLQFVRENPDLVKDGMRRKGEKDLSLVDQLLTVDVERREALTSLQEKQSHSKTISKQVGQLMKAGKKDEAQAIIQETARLKEELKGLQVEADKLEAKQLSILLNIPNVPHETVPAGFTENDNVVDAEIGEKPSFDFDARPHWELIEKHDLVDFDRGSKVTGAGFPFYKGKGARLQRALINFFLNENGEQGYEEMQAPLLVNEASGMGTGQLPDKEDQMYEVQRDQLYLIPTAETPLTNYHRDEILEEKTLPVKFVGYTPCFRREAGSYGANVRGLNRLHQFDKVEILQLVHPDTSYDVHESMREDSERLLGKLGLPFRRLLMCGGDLGFAQAKKYDLEIWSAGQERWLEVSSISNFETYQARRAKIRFRPAGGGKAQLVHTLNGSALALPRIMAGIIEQYQNEDGSITIPDVLRPYTGFDKIG